MSNQDQDLFDDLDAELEGLDLDTPSEETKKPEPAKEEPKKVEEKKTVAGDVDAFFNQVKTPPKENISKGKSKKGVKKGIKQEEEKPFEGPRPVVVYGQELWIENDPKITLEQIREKIVNDYQFPEFSKDRTSMTFDKDTGIVVPAIRFEKKG
jgi:hypothetical protein